MAALQSGLVAHSRRPLFSRCPFPHIMSLFSLFMSPGVSMPVHCFACLCCCSLQNCTVASSAELTLCDQTMCVSLAPGVYALVSCNLTNAAEIHYEFFNDSLCSVPVGLNVSFDDHTCTPTNVPELPATAAYCGEL